MLEESLATPIVQACDTLYWLMRSGQKRQKMIETKSRTVTKTVRAPANEKMDTCRPKVYLVDVSWATLQVFCRSNVHSKTLLSYYFFFLFPSRATLERD